MEMQRRDFRKNGLKQGVTPGQGFVDFHGSSMGKVLEKVVS